MVTAFEKLVERVEPDLRRALAGHVVRGVVEDAVAEALAYAWENRERVLEMENPTGSCSGWRSRVRAVDAKG